MELRSGRVLSFQNHGEDPVIQELKTLFKLLFYHMGERLAIQEKLLDFRLTHGRGPNLIELKSFRVDRDTWRKLFHKVWHRIQLEVPPRNVIQLIPHLLLQEYGIQPEHPRYSEPHGILTEYIQDLYKDHNCDRMIELMFEELRINEQAPTVRDRKLYLNQIAERLAYRLHFYVPDTGTMKQIIPWETFLKSARNECCFFSKNDGGSTVVKLPYTYFTMPATYEYRILETGQTFTSCETNARKALLFHKRCTQKH